MQLCAQWWFVITRPSGDTNDPEHPPASRTEESCASASHFESGENSYFFATLALGKLSYVHIPSSARPARGSAQTRHRAAIRTIVGSFEGRLGRAGPRFCPQPRTASSPTATAPDGAGATDSCWNGAVRCLRRGPAKFALTEATLRQGR